MAAPEELFLVTDAGRELVRLADEGARQGRRVLETAAFLRRFMDTEITSGDLILFKTPTEGRVGVPYFARAWLVAHHYIRVADSAMPTVKSALKS